MSLFSVDDWNLPSKVAKEPKKTKSGSSKKKSKEPEPDLDSLIQEHIEGRKVQLTKETTVEKKRNKEKKEKKRKRDGDDELNTESSKSSLDTSAPADAEDEVAVPEPQQKQVKLTPMQQKMQEKLTGSRFRWINEQLYTLPSPKALRLIKENPGMFDEYHNGFRHQVKLWPQNPVEKLVEQFKGRLDKPIAAPGGLPGDSKTSTVVVADMGCGEAQLALDLQKVKGHGKTKKAKFVIHSFDLKKANDRITVADIKNVPLENGSVNVVVFCLALMGTNFLDFIREGLRILKPRGEIWIAEIKSRFVESDFHDFVRTLKAEGLLHKTTDDSNKMFVRFEFFKPPKEIQEQQEQKRRSKPKFVETDNSHEGKAEGEWLLKPCLYKRR